jgi:hypothetical protein
MEGDYVYGVDSYGELRCLDARTGNRIWEDLTAVPKNRWATIHMVRNAGRMFMFNDRGELLIGTLSPHGFHEISRAKLIAPTGDQFKARGGVCWSHPAYAYKHIFARSDRELVCASLAAEKPVAEQITRTSQSAAAAAKTGTDETMEVDPANLRFLYQGASDAEYRGHAYAKIPWRLGILELAR